jgi:intein/homing endonuclease
MKKVGVASLKKKADKYFSLAIRYRDAEFNRGEWLGTCISCGVQKPLKELQAGHFVSRRVSSLRYDYENVNAQCLTKESNVRMFNGTHKSISKLKTGDELWAFNEDDHSLIEKTIVEHTEAFVPDELYEIELDDGSKFWSTGDHRVVANGKWVYVSQMLHDVSAYDILEL